MDAINVGQLKKLIENLPDDTLIFTPGRDHEFMQGTASYIKVVYEKRYNGYSEYIEHYYPEEETKSYKVIHGLVID